MIEIWCLCVMAGLLLLVRTRFRSGFVVGVFGVLCLALVPLAGAEPMVAVTVWPSSFRLGVNEELRLSAAAHYADGSQSNISLLATWSNSNPSCLILTSEVVRGAASGQSTITATYAGTSAVSSISVYAPSFITNYSVVTGSTFGCSAAAWASVEGWTNFQNAGLHYMRMPIDLSPSAIVDDFFMAQYDALVRTGQLYDVVMYGIVNPTKSGTNWPSVSSFTNNLSKIVERYDGDGASDMSGLQYPIRNWEICNEILYYAALATNHPWYGFGKDRYHSFISNSLIAIRQADPQSALLNGAQIAPPSKAITYEGTSTLWNVVTELGTGSLDAVSYHDYAVLLEADQAWADFTSLNITNKPVWISEADMQWEWDMNTNLTQEANARLLPQGFAYALAKGCDKIIGASMRARTNDPAMVQWGSLLEPTSGARRKVYYSYSKLVEKTDYFTAASTNFFHDGTNSFSLEFTVLSRPVVMLWATSNVSTQYTVTGTNISGVKVTRSVPSDDSGVFGVEHLTVSNGQVSLSVSNIAIYIEELTNSCPDTSDLDGDSIPDAWELSFRPSLTNMNYSSDFDGDKFLDGEEYLAGTDPTNSASLLKFTTTGVDVTGNFYVVMWNSATGKSYSILRTTNLMEGFYGVLFSNIVAVPPSNTKTDTTVTITGQHFYRVRLE